MCPAYQLSPTTREANITWVFRGPSTHSTWRSESPWHPFLGPQRSKHHIGVCFSGVRHACLEAGEYYQKKRSLFRSTQHGRDVNSAAPFRCSRSFHHPFSARLSTGRTRQIAQRSKHHIGVCFSGVYHISIPYRTDDQAKNAEKQTSHWCLLLWGASYLESVRNGNLGPCNSFLPIMVLDHVLGLSKSFRGLD